MDKIIIIGNGFDLAHGLKTRYSDFLLWYFQQALSQIYKEDRYEDKLLSIEGDHKSVINIDKLDDIDKLPKDSLKFKSDYFKDIVGNYKKLLWVDLESDYYSRLLKIYKEHETNNKDHWDITISSIIGLNRVFDALQEKLVEYLDSIKITPAIQNREIYELLTGIVKPDFDQLIAKGQPSSNCMFLNFNYTNTLSLYEKEITKNIINSIINIHGSLGRKDNPIIFGYGDEMDPYYANIENLNNNEFLKNIKSFSYFKTDNYKRFINFVEGSEFIVYILGHSCGISDRILLNSIFENKNCQSIQIFYHQRENDTDFFEKTQEISRHFKPQNKELMRKRIVPFPECSPLTSYNPDSN